jgi:hypothetical protein
MLRLIAAVAAAIACAGAAHAGPSSFQRSCSDIRLEHPAGDVVLVATCRDRAGRGHPADFELTGYHNIDGRLVFDGRGKSSFQRSCDRIDVAANQNGVLMVAHCRTRDQRVVRTSIEIQDLHNIDGRLVRSASNAPPPGLPPAAGPGPRPGPNLACNGLAGSYNRSASIITVGPGNSVTATVGPNRPPGRGTCDGSILRINFSDDRVVSGVFDGRTISWDNRTTWTRD